MDGAADGQGAADDVTSAAREPTPVDSPGESLLVGSAAGPDEGATESAGEATSAAVTDVGPPAPLVIDVAARTRTVDEPVETASVQRRPWWRPRRLGYLGLVGALVGFVASMAPSLLPRPPLFLGIIAGVSMVIGYGLGTLVSWLIRRVDVPELPRRVKRVAWWTLAVAGPLVFVGSLIAGGVWQNEVRVLVGEDEAPTFAWLALVLAPLVGLLILAAARGVRAVTRGIDRVLGRFLPARLASTVGFVLVALLLYWLAAGVLVNTAVDLADSVYSATNDTTAPGVVPATSSERSGGPGSLVSWQSLGLQGRSFIGSGPTQAQIAAVTGKPAVEPIRVYAGLESADSAQARAALVVRELERTGAFDRKVLVVAGATGTGWLEPQGVDSVEYLWGGDTAIATIQYSYLPSWISFLVDADRASEAGTALFDAVHAAWEQRPAAARPKLIVYGLSLGSFAIQSAFASPGDVTARTDGALFVGTPDFTPLWSSITATRDPGSPQWQPVYGDGATVRFGATAADFGTVGGAWNGARVGYLQHASDPVVWWSPDLMTREPDWLVEPRGPDVSPRTRWYPFVTFLGVTVDQFFGTTVPLGYGHNYGSAMVGAWQAVVPAPGITSARLAAVEQAVAQTPDD